MPTTSSPIRLSDAQMDAVLAASFPLQPSQRAAFLEDVARALAQLPELGDGALHRLIMEIQRRHFDPPDFATDNGNKGGAAVRTKRRTG